MTGPNRGSPIYRVLFANPETTFGTDPTGYPVAADAVRIISASVSVKAPTQAREDAFGTGTKNGSIDLKLTAEWSVDMYLYTAGAASTAPDVDDLLQNCLLLQRQDAVSNSAVSGGTATTTVIPITEGHGANFTAGKSCVTISGETRRIASINTGANPDELTLSVPLSTAPASGVVVTSGITYFPHDGADSDPDGCTLWIGNNAHMWRLTGSVATSGAITGGGDGAIRISMSGRAREAVLLYTGTIASSMSSSQLTATVANVDIVPDDVSATNPYYFTIDKGEASEENVKVTAKNTGTNVLTIERSSPSGSAFSHNSGATIEPYQPAGTYTGSPIPATGGHCYMADVLTQVETFSTEIDTGLIVREDEHGRNYKMSDYVQGLRTVTMGVESWSVNNPNMHRVRDALQRASADVFAQQGDTTGSIVAVECPEVFSEAPDFSFDDGEVRLSFTGEARGSVENEVFILIG